MSATVFGYCMIVLGCIWLCTWVGMWLGNRVLRKSLALKELCLGTERCENLRLARHVGAAEEQIDKLKAQLIQRNADLVRCQTALRQYERLRGADGRFARRAQ